MPESPVPQPANLIVRVTAWALSRKPVRALLLYVESRGPQLADSVTYRALFSLFAGVLLGFSIAALWLAGNPAAYQALIDALNAVIPGLVGEDGLVDPDNIRLETGLTVTGVISLLALTGAAIGAIGSLRSAIRIIADTARSDILWIWVLLRNLLVAVGFGGILLVAAAMTFVGTAGVGAVLSWLGASPDSLLAELGTRAVTIVVVFVLDAIAIAVLFLFVSGLRPSARALWSGALLGGVGLTVLQQLSGLFVGGARANPLLATFASLIALLLWVNLSTQVILIASAYIVTSVAEENDRVRARYGATTFLQRRVRKAEDGVRAAAAELEEARKEEAAERERAAKAAVTS